MKYNIFFSWQTDLPNKSNRSLIKSSIEKAIKNLSSDATNGSIFFYDESARNEVGSPNIGETIFEKIAKTDIFICDVSIINKGSKFRKTPNPNVMCELGYAASSLGWDKIICIFDTALCKIEQLPFDINHRRVLQYSSKSPDVKKELSFAIQHSINAMCSKGILYNPLKDHLKGKIDFCILSILQQICCIIFGTETMSEALSKVDDLLHLKQADVYKYLIDGHQVLGFFTENHLGDIREKLDIIFTAITTSTVFPQQWSLTVLKLIDWLRNYQWYISDRSLYPLSSKDKQSIAIYDVLNAASMNPSNPKDSYILVKRVGKAAGQVMFAASMPKIDKHVLLTMQKICADNAEAYSKCFYSAINISQKWLIETGSEFILDPDYYEITHGL